MLETPTGGVPWENAFLIISEISWKNIYVWDPLSLQIYNFIKKRVQHKFFPMKVVTFLRAPIYRTSASVDCFWS